ncbi:CoA transferase [Actinoplanes bogorensis]|uniref:CoA transferase n=1 Tax=Paractinoplanes bogorensis TaxID=1610840 RepID=A0ABS5YUR8_9ACTN|nr:CoA transferase [Actinoplanes bogorensis]MBU2667197.1 CoA transferase [Actinoplanes bogorensis]
MLPLADVRIVAVEQYGAGPFGSSHLAALGAEVIKIENPAEGGDVGRYVPPYRDGDDSLFFQTFNRNKRSLSLDLTTDAGREVFHDLVRVSDAVYSNLRGDVPERLGLTYAQLSDVNRAIVCCSLSGFGMTGRRRAQPGYDYLFQALTGWMDLTGDPDGPPTKSGLSLVDYTGGYVAALALVSGVHAARRDGRGMDCDVSLYDTAAAMLTYQATWAMSAGYEGERYARSAHPSIVPFQAFEAADGWMIVGCAKQKFWDRLTALLGDDALHDPRFADFPARLEHRAELVEVLDAHFVRRPVERWMELLNAAGIPCAPVNGLTAALAEPHLADRDMIVETRHDRFGTVRSIASPVRVGAERPVPRPAPERDEAREYVLGDLLGYAPDDRERLRDGGAFGA